MKDCAGNPLSVGDLLVCVSTPDGLASLYFEGVVGKEASIVEPYGDCPTGHLQIEGPLADWLRDFYGQQKPINVPPEQSRYLLKISPDPDQFKDEERKTVTITVPGIPADELIESIRTAVREKVLP